MEQLTRKIEESDEICLALLFVVAFLALLPSLLDLFHGHDYLDHVGWNLEFVDDLKAGILYPRWLPDINSGNGGPGLIFYSPFYFYVDSIFGLPLGTLAGIKIGMFLLFYASGVATYFCARQWLSRTVSLITALAYLLMSYHLYDIHMRAALAEFAQFLWPPLIILTLKKISDGSKKAVFAFGLCIAGSVLTHLPTALMILYILGPVAVYFLIRNRQIGGRMVTGIAYGLLLSSIYLLPVFWESKYIYHDYYLLFDGGYTTHFLFSSSNFPGRRSILLWALAQAVVLFGLIVSCGLPSRDFKKDELLQCPKIFLLVGLFSIFMMLPISAFLWNLPGMKYVRFPWRYLMIGSVASSFLIGFRAALWHETSTFRKAIILVLLFLNLGLAGRPWLQRLQIALTPHTEKPAPVENARYFHDVNSPPIWVSSIKEGEYIGKHQTLAPAVRMEQGNGTAKVIRWESAHREIEVDAKIDALLQLRLYYFPGWNCAVDANPVVTKISKEGQIVVPVAAGKHHVLCKFTNTPVRTAGAVTSLATLLCGLALLLKKSA